MRYYRANANFDTAVTLQEVRANSRTDSDAEDELLARLIVAAQERAEQETGMVFGEGEWIIEAEPLGDLLIPVWPMVSVGSITNGADPFTDFTVVRAGRSVYLRSGAWPDAVTIRVTAGMPAPETVRQAIILMASFWFDNRATASAEAMREIPYGATDLLGLNRRMFA